MVGIFLEGVVVLPEVMHELRRTRDKDLIFKIDFEKVYDKVKSNFLKVDRERKGFADHWT